MKIYLLSFILLIMSLSAQAAPKKILMVVNEGYRPEEYFTPRKLFDAQGFNVTVSGHYEGVVLPSKKHVSEVPPVKVDVTFDKASVQNYDAIVFVGGNGAWNDMLPNPSVHKLLFDSIKQEKITALICAATGLLATAGNLDGNHPRFKGRHVTGYFEVEGLLKKVGLLKYDPGITGKPYVVVDGKIITGKDPASAALFGEIVISALKSETPQ